MRVLATVVVLGLVGGAVAIAGTGNDFSEAAGADAAEARGANSAASTNVWPWRSSANGQLGPDYSTEVDAVAHTAVLEPESAIAVANLTVRPGQYVVRYAFEARLDSAWRPVELRCGVVDGNGTKAFLFDDSEPVRAGQGWVAYRAETTFSLPDITLGLRCFPSATGFSSASFRNVSLSVTTIPF
ncbi:hypothetical protein GCM10027057_20360 [Marisediminicola antarctica]|uniref:CBM-cenC domain-containing protein n=2 Tax=Marisediminicola antarctica TaxID=674079 RepID=A0A7L5AJW6_9MICO|nr:hypothetical protein BHD05_06885 [Marisediminicola antarctica]